MNIEEQTKKQIKKKVICEICNIEIYDLNRHKNTKLHINNHNLNQNIKI